MSSVWMRVVGHANAWRTREHAALRLDSGDELRVEVERDDLGHEEIVVRRAGTNGVAAAGLLAAIDQHLASALPHPARTTDRLLEADRQRPY